MHRHNGRTYHTVSARQRNAVPRNGTPAENLLEELQHSAIERLECVTEFLRDWPAKKLRLFPDAYERLRAEAYLHLAWIFEPAAARVFTFRDICHLSSHPALNDFENILDHIRGLIDASTRTELRRPLDPWQAHQAAYWWLEEGPSDNYELGITNYELQK